MLKYLVTGKQVIQYQFEIEIPDGMTPQEFLEGKAIDHDTLLSSVNSNEGQFVTGYPEVIFWELPEYTDIIMVED